MGVGAFFMTHSVARQSRVDIGPVEHHDDAVEACCAERQWWFDLGRWALNDCFPTPPLTSPPPCNMVRLFKHCSSKHPFLPAAGIMPVPGALNE